MKKKWYFENLREEALKHETRSEFKNGNNNAYRVAYRRDDYELIVSHMPKHVVLSGENNGAFKWSYDILKTEALRFQTRGDFAKGSPRAYEASWKRDDFEEICAHMTIPINKSYTNQELHNIALTYSTRGNFCQNSPSAYAVARKRKILDVICSHMAAASNKKYTTEQIQKEANCFSNRVDFYRSKAGVYSAAQKMGILDQICSHMKFSSKTSRPEREILKAIKAIYKEAKTLRDVSVLIPGKPHIHGFEVDIFFNNKGIEFDGTYHHSFEGLKIGRPHWPDEDIRNYHEIKDAWFLSKGIQILHIKEEDWIKDKEECIKKCLDFLTIS